METSWWLAGTAFKERVAEAESAFGRLEIDDNEQGGDVMEGFD